MNGSMLRPAGRLSLLKISPGLNPTSNTQQAAIDQVFMFEGGPSTNPFVPSGSTVDNDPANASTERDADTCTMDSCDLKRRYMRLVARISATATCRQTPRTITIHVNTNKM